MSEMVMKQKKIRIFSSAPWMRTLFMCQFDLKSILQLNSNLFLIKCGNIIHIRMVGNKREFILLYNKNIQHWC